MPRCYVSFLRHLLKDYSISRYMEGRGSVDDIRFVFKVGQVDPNGTNLGLFQIREFLVIMATEMSDLVQIRCVWHYMRQIFCNSLQFD